MSSIAQNLHFRQNLDTPKSEDSVLPTTLFIHGLDSSSHTWRNVLDELNSPAVGIDCRGCGKTPLGNPEEFSEESIVQDIHNFVQNHPLFQRKEDNRLRPFVVVGHSMGGRIAMSFAREFPQCIAALVIEDMDIRKRPLADCDIRTSNRDETVGFDRNLGTSSSTDVIERFRKEGYPESFVSRWLQDGRISLQRDGNYYSQVNPAFRLLCYETFFETNHGEEVWQAIADQSQYDFKCHVMVAGESGTVCDESSVNKMKNIMLPGNPLRMFLYRYKDAGHSIHNSAKDAFMNDLKNIISSAPRD